MGLLLGSESLAFATADQTSAGREEAYGFIGTQAGLVEELMLHTNGIANTGVTSLILGIMADNGSGKPGAVLGQGTFVGTPAINTWIKVTGLAIPISANTQYYLVLLPIGGQIHFNVANAGGLDFESKAGGLTKIEPETEWETFNEGPIAFAAIGKVGVTIPLNAASSSSSGAMALTAKTQIPLTAAASTSTAQLALTAKTTIPLAAAASVSSASIALSAKTTIALSSASSASVASMALTAATRIPLNAASSSSTASATVTGGKGTTIPLNAASSTSSSSMSMHAATRIALNPASSASSATAQLVIVYSGGGETINAAGGASFQSVFADGENL